MDMSEFFEAVQELSLDLSADELISLEYTIYSIISQLDWDVKVEIV